MTNATLTQIGWETSSRVQCSGQVLIMGRHTFSAVPDLAFKDRDIVEIHASDRPEDVPARFPSRIVFIGGGPPNYAAYAPSIRHWDINRLPYDAALR